MIKSIITSPESIPKDISKRITSSPTSTKTKTALTSDLTTPELFDKLAKNANRRPIRKYYESQAELLRNFKEDKLLLEKFVETDECPTIVIIRDAENKKMTDKRKRLCDQIITNVTLILNIFLFLIKIVAAILSHSLSIISSVIDSAVDLTSSIVIFLTTRAIRKRDPYLYPRGRTRLEPLAVIVVSVIMGIASVQMVIESLESIAKNLIAVNCDWWTIGIMITTIVIKFGLFIVCKCFPSPNTDLLAQDHRNDCLSNTVAIVCAFIADHYWKYFDSIGAILVSLYIFGTWWSTGSRYIRILSGRAAKPEFYSRIIRVAFEHDPTHIREIDTVQVYHLGTEFLVEVHVVLDRNMPVHQAHDISETLQRKIEHLPYVERSFVHVDYEATHRPDLEHKVV